MNAPPSFALVTGATSGLGLAIARALLERGWQVTGVGRREAALRHLAYRHVRLDLADLERVEAFAAEVAADPGTLAARRLALVNGAATVGPVAPIAELRARDLAAVFALNAAAPLLLAGALVRESRGRLLRVLNVSSGAARRPYAGWGAYCATKAALRLGGMILAAEAAAGSAGAPEAVVSYEPGVLDTAMQAEVRAARPEAFPALPRFVALQAEGKLLPPELPAAEIADLLERDDLPFHSELRFTPP